MTLSDSVDFLYGMLRLVEGRLKNSTIINIIVVSTVVVVVIVKQGLTQAGIGEIINSDSKDISKV